MADLGSLWRRGWGTSVYTSGMVGVDTDFNVPEDPADEFRQVFENLAGVLEAMGTSLDHVVESTEFVAGDIEALFPIFEAVRKEIFGGRLPASTCVCVKRLLEARYRGPGQVRCCNSRGPHAIAAGADAALRDVCALKDRAGDH